MVDALKNFAASLVATAPSPATSGTSMIVTAGQGALFPAAPFNAVCWPSGVAPTAANAEIVRVTAISTDTFTITRAQEGTTAQSIAVGWNISQNVTAELLAQFLPLSGGTMSGPIIGFEDKGGQVFNVKAYGAVGNGTTDDTTAINAAIAAAVANTPGGIVYLAPGTYKVSSVLTVNVPTVSIIGAGTGSTTIQPTSAVTGDTIRVQMSPFGSTQAGTFSGFTVDGTNAGAGAVGFHFGDVVGGRVDIVVQNFTGAGSIGAHLDNNIDWTEENHIKVVSLLNTVGIKFDVTGTGTNSFGYNDFDFWIRVGGGVYSNQVGITIPTAALVYSCRFRVTGNIDGTGCVGFQTTTTGTTYGGLQYSLIQINLEANSTTPTAVIQLGGYTLFSGTGIVNTNAASAVTSTASWAGGIDFAGQWNVTGITLTTDAPVTTSNTVTLTNKRVTKRVLALSANSATPAINTDNYDVVNITAQTAAITSFTSGLTGTPVDGDTLRVSITGTAAVTLTWGASFEASTVALPTTTVTTARLDVGFFWNAATSKWRCEAVG